MEAPARVTVREIASAAGVSVATVSRVLNQPELVQPDKRDAVRRAVLELDYIPNRHARSLSSQRSGAVGLLVPTLANPLFAPTIAAIERALDAAGQALLIHCYQRDPARQLKQVRHLVERGVDGLILTGATTSPALTALLARTGIPHVVQDAVLAPGGARSVAFDNPRSVAFDNAPSVAFDNAPSVAFDNAGAMALAVRHLHRNGHDAIAVLSGPVHNTPAVAERFAGAVREVQALGLRLPDGWRVLTRDYDNASVREGAARLLDGTGPTGAGPNGAGPTGAGPDTPFRPTAVACTGDILALGLVAECQRRGLRVPCDLSVIGCGNTDMGQYVEPALTTIGLPWDRMGAAAVASLLARIAGRFAEPLVILPHTLVERRSVQAPRPAPPHSASPGAGS